MKTFKSVLIVLYYFLVQIVVCTGVVLYKFASDPEWVGRCVDVYSDSYTFADSISVASELVLPAVIITDIIIVTPLLFKSRFSMFRKMEKIQILDLVMVGLGCNFIITTVVGWLEKLPIAQSYNDLMNFTLNGDAFFMILTAGILAPLVEEICFRYWMFDVMKGKSDTFKIIVSAILFGVAHFNIIQSTYAFLMGLVLGYAYAKTKNLWSSILIHFSVNMSSVIFELLPTTGQTIFNVVFLLSVFYSAYTLILKKNVLTEEVVKFQ